MAADERPADPPRGDAALRRLMEKLRRGHLAQARAFEEYLGIAPARAQRERPEGKGRVWENEDEAGYKTA